MKNCRNCGQDLQDDDKFCSNCGQEVEVEEVYPQDDQLDDMDKTRIIEDINPYLEDQGEEGEDFDHSIYEDEYYNQQEGESRIGRVLRSRTTYIALALVVALAGAFYLFRGRIQGQDNRQELVEEFIQSLEKRDASTVARLLTSSDPGLKIDKKGIEALFRYMDQDPDFVDRTRTSLGEQLKFYDNKKEDIGDIFENIVLRKDREEYYLEIKPYYLRLGVNVANADIFMEEEKLTRSDREDFSQELGPFMPGVYRLKAKYQDMQVEEEISLMDPSPDRGKNVKSLDFSLELVSLSLRSNFPDAFLLINGEKTPSRLRDLEGGRLGPIPANTQLALSYETPFGEFRSQDYLAGQVEGSDLQLDIEIRSDQLDQALMTRVNAFVMEDAKAKTSLDPSHYSQLEEPEYSRRLAQIEALKGEGDQLEFRPLATSYDLDSIEIEQKDSSYYGQLKVRVEMEESQANDLTLDIGQDLSYGLVVLVYRQDTSSWMIQEIRAIDEFNIVNTKDFKL